MNNEIITRRGYVFKYGPLYLGWIMKRVEPAPVLYSENSPTLTLTGSELSIEYLTVGFIENRVLKKLSKFLDDEQLKSIRRAAKMREEGPDVAYICDGHGCDAHCELAGVEHEYCRHTCDISHAVNFKQVAPGKWMEVLDNEKEMSLE